MFHFLPLTILSDFIRTLTTLALLDFWTFLKILSFLIKDILKEHGAQRSL